MYTKDECKGILRELSLETGFPYPEKRAKIEERQYNNERWNFDPKSKEIAISQIIDKFNSNEFNKGKMRFAISHEFGHAVLDFVLKNKIDAKSVANLTVREYTNLLKKYYKTPFIKATTEDLIKFQNFVQSNPFLREKSMRGVLEFDDKYYVSSRTSIGTDKLYTNNTVEVFANIFAVQMTSDKYKGRDDIDADFMAGLSDKARWAVMSIETDRQTKSKEDFATQICTHIPFRQQKGKTRDMIVNEFDYNNIGFDKFYKNINPTLTQAINTTIEMKDMYPTKQERQEKEAIAEKERQKLENAKKQLKELASKDSRVTLLQSFEPEKADAEKFDSLQCNIHSMATHLQGFLSTKQYCEAIGDLGTGKIYCFKEARTVSIADSVLDENEKTQMTESKREDKTIDISSLDDNINL